MTSSFARAWWARAALLVLAVVGGQVVLTVMGFAPRLLGWTLLATVGASLLWLVLDATDTRAVGWDASLPPFVRPDVGEATAHSRVLDGQLDSRDPGPALRNPSAGSPQPTSTAT